MKKLLAVLGLWFAAGLTTAIIQSCDDGCGNGGPIYQHLSALHTEANRITGIEKQYDQPYYILQPADSTENIRYDSLVIEVAHSFTAFAKQIPGLFDFNKALACDPVVNFSKIARITITSSQDYNTNFPKGADLAEIMQLHRYKIVNGIKVSEVSTKTIPEAESSDWYYTFL